MSLCINPYTDFGFKKLFGEDDSKDLLIDFLNQVLPEAHHIRDLSFKPLFLKNLASFDSIPIILREPVFEKGFEIAKLANMKKAEWNAYEKSLMNCRDMHNVVDTAVMESAAKVRAEALEEGEKIGIKKAIGKMREAGVDEEQIRAIFGETDGA